MGRRSDVDWERVERLYVAGQMTIREIADEIGVADSSIRLKAKQNNWQRNLADAIKERSKAKIAQIDVQELIEQSAKESAHKSALTIQQAIEEASNVHAGVVLRHRRFIREDFERAIRIESALDEALSADCLELGDVIKATQAYKALVDAKAKLIDKERQAHGIEDDADSSDDGEQITISVGLVEPNG